MFSLILGTKNSAPRKLDAPVDHCLSLFVLYLRHISSQSFALSSSVIFLISRGMRMCV